MRLCTGGPQTVIDAAQGVAGRSVPRRRAAQVNSHDGTAAHFRVPPVKFPGSETARCAAIIAAISR